MRIPIYPDAEGFIKLKKQGIYEKQQQQEEEATAAHNNFRGQAKEKKGNMKYILIMKQKNSSF